MGSIIICGPKIYTDKMLAGIMHNLQIQNALSVIGLTLVVLLFFSFYFLNDLSSGLHGKSAW